MAASSVSRVARSVSERCHQTQPRSRGMFADTVKRIRHVLQILKWIALDPGVSSLTRSIKPARSDAESKNGLGLPVSEGSWRVAIGGGCVLFENCVRIDSRESERIHTSPAWRSVSGWIQGRALAFRANELSG